MKVLPSSMRVKRRYLKFKIESDRRLTRRDIIDAIHSAGTSLFGDYGMSLINLQFIEFDESTGHGIVRCARERVDDVRAVLATINNIRGAPSATRVVRVSGTLKGVKR